MCVCRGVGSGDGWVGLAKPGPWSVWNAASVRLSVARLKSFNPFGVESPDGA